MSSLLKSSRGQVKGTFVGLDDFCNSSMDDAHHGFVFEDEKSIASDKSQLTMSPQKLEVKTDEHLVSLSTSGLTSPKPRLSPRLSPTLSPTKQLSPIRKLADSQFRDRGMKFGIS